MNFILKIFCLIFLAATSNLCEAQLKDSTTLEEVVIVGTRPGVFSVGSRISSIDSSYLANYNSSKLSDVLQSRSPVYIKSYGPGMLSTISMRGASSQQTALMWNGFNINFPTLGQADFALIPVNGFSTVDIQYGSSSSNYGSSAIGGSILLSSKPDWKNKLGIQFQQDFGSFRTFYSNGKISFGNKKVQSCTQVYRNNSANNFSYVNTAVGGFPKERQVNAAINQYGITQDLFFKISSRTELSALGWYSFSDRQIQPSMNSINSNTWEIDKNFRLMSSLNHLSKIGTSEVRLAFFDDQINYTNEKSDMKTYQTQIQHTVSFNEKLKLKAGGDAQLYNARVEEYGRPVNEIRSSVFGLLRYDPIKILNISLNLRKAMIQGYKPPLAPTLGIGLKVIQLKNFTSSLKGNVSGSYRVPTLNERFWPTGNPKLKPESGKNYEAGIVNKFSHNKFSWESELTYFHMLIDNWVQWLPVNSFNYTPVNVNQVKSRGLELSSKINFRFNKVNLTAGLAGSHVISTNNKTSDIGELNKQLLYVPLNTFSFYTDISYKRWFSTVNINYTDLRYTNSHNTASIPSYSLVNCLLGCTVIINDYRLQIILRVNNLLNTAYQNYEYRATPLRNFSVSVKFNFNKP